MHYLVRYHNKRLNCEIGFCWIRALSQVSFLKYNLYETWHAYLPWSIELKNENISKWNHTIPWKKNQQNIWLQCVICRWFIVSNLQNLFNLQKPGQQNLFNLIYNIIHSVKETFYSRKNFQASKFWDGFSIDREPNQIKAFRKTRRIEILFALAKINLLVPMKIAFPSFKMPFCFPVFLYLYEFENLMNIGFL